MLASSGLASASASSPLAVSESLACDSGEKIKCFIAVISSWEDNAAQLANQFPDPLLASTPGFVAQYSAITFRTSCLSCSILKSPPCLIWDLPPVGQNIRAVVLYYVSTDSIIDREGGNWRWLLKILNSGSSNSFYCRDMSILSSITCNEGCFDAPIT
jgi:hypothetical protein